MGLSKPPRRGTFVLQITSKVLGFNDSSVDTSLFARNFGGEFVILLIYVDDILVTGNKNAALPKLLRELGSLFAMKDLGPLHYSLGIEAHRASSNLYLKQSMCWTYFTGQT